MWNPFHSILHTGMRINLDILAMRRIRAGVPLKLSSLTDGPLKFGFAWLGLPPRSPHLSRRWRRNPTIHSFSTKTNRPNVTDDLYSNLPYLTISKRAQRISQHQPWSKLGGQFRPSRGKAANSLFQKILRASPYSTIFCPELSGYATLTTVKSEFYGDREKMWGEGVFNRKQRPRRTVRRAPDI